MNLQWLSLKINEEIYENNEIDVSEASIIESAMTFIKDKLTYNELNTLVLVENALAGNDIKYPKDGTIYLIKTLEDELSIEEYDNVPEAISKVLDVIIKQ